MDSPKTLIEFMEIFKTEDDCIYLLATTKKPLSAAELAR